MQNVKLTQQEKGVLLKELENMVLNTIRQLVEKAETTDELYELLKSNVVLQKQKEETLEQKVTNILNQLEIPAHIKGYSYLRYAIIVSVLEHKQMHNRNSLCKKVSDFYETTPSKVERSMRYAVDVAWDRGNMKNMVNVSYKPSMEEFISLAADSIRLSK